MRRKASTFGEQHTEQNEEKPSMPHFPLEGTFIFAHRPFGLKIFCYILTATQIIFDNAIHKTCNRNDLFLQLALHSAAAVLQLSYLSTATSWVW